MRPHGDGKGGTYFGATGCGKSYTMVFLSRILMRSTHFASPTIVVITDRTDLMISFQNSLGLLKNILGITLL